jgi:hypothetical protein
VGRFGTGRGDWGVDRGIAAAFAARARRAGFAVGIVRAATADHDQ